MTTKKLKRATRAAQPDYPTAEAEWQIKTLARVLAEHYVAGDVNSDSLDALLTSLLVSNGLLTPIQAGAGNDVSFDTEDNEHHFAYVKHVGGTFRIKCDAPENAPWFGSITDQARHEDPPPYGTQKPVLLPDWADPDGMVEAAKNILLSRMRVPGRAMQSPQEVKDYVALVLTNKDQEHFGCMFLDAQNCVVASEVLFNGSLSSTRVYPRVVVQRALAHNAGAVILYHNHPSGKPEPSRADEFLTTTLKHALGLVDVRVLDHLVVGGPGNVVSFAERGLL